MDPQVSVCVPTYNGAAYLGACLDSILRQTFSDFEVLVVDDGSSDGTVAIATAYAQRDPRLRVVVNEGNRGLVGNWNRCVELSHGSWIKFVFQDDLIAPTCIAQMLSAGMKSKKPIISCGRELMFEGGSPEELREKYEKTRAMIEALFQASNEWSARDFSEAVLSFPNAAWNLLGEPSAVLLHRSVFRQFGWFNPQIRMLCDFEFWARVASNTGNVHVRERLATFRVHENSVSGYFRRTRARQYRFELLDPLLILHEFAFHPVYAGLRAIAKNRLPQGDLVEEFWGRAVAVRWYAKQAMRDRAQPDHSLLEEWHKAAQECPRLGAIPLRARCRSKWRALKRTVSSQFRRQQVTT